MRSLLLLIIGLMAGACSRPAPQVSIVPKPVSITLNSGELDISHPIQIEAPANPEGVSLATFAKQALEARGFMISDKGTRLSMSLVEYDTIQPEGFYEVTVTPVGIHISSSSNAGLFYGIQTVLQLATENTDSKSIPFLTIADYPRFSYRGLHLDAGRHFFPVSFVKQYIDWLAFHKFNYFHWHLTEDQGWRIEIKKFPALQTVGSQRKETLVGHAGIPETFDGTPYGGFYTQEEIKDVVAYAAERYVTIIPEIEMPGHSLAALAAYPSLGCTGGPYEVGTKWGVFPDVFCAGKDETFEFLQQVLDEVMILFPGTYIHVGGDESPKTRWKVCPNCQKRIKKEGLKDEHELQSYFIQRIEKYLNDNGRRLIGWDEILEGGLAPNATVMSWRGEAGGIAAAKEKHQVIMTPGDWCYFDHYQDSAKTEPLAIGGLTTVKDVYGYEPVPASLSQEEAKLILGAQANLWSEYITTPSHAAYMVYPRACAMAEVLWSPKDSKDYADFLARMQVHLPRLDSLGINYARHMVKEFPSKNK